MEIIPVSKLHYRLFNEIDTFVETGYCSYWQCDTFNQFVKPCVIKDLDGYYKFKKISNKDNNTHLLLTRKFSNDNYINIYYDYSDYIYEHYENNKLILKEKNKDYMIIHDIIINQMVNNKNILLVS